MPRHCNSNSIKPTNLKPNKKENIKKIDLLSITMKILQECKQFLSCAGLGTEQYVHIGGKRIPRMMIRATLTFVLLSGAILQYINTINSFADGIQAMLFPIHFLIHNSMKWAVYCVFLWKTNKIAELIDRVETVVNRRKLFFL